jgi:hypothetical protein
MVSEMNLKRINKLIYHTGLLFQGRGMVVCDKCGEIHVEIKEPFINPGDKFERAVDSLQKALGYDSERQQREISPFKSVRDLEDLSKERVEKLLLRFYNELIKWFTVEKASSDPFILNGRFFINPKSGKPLTRSQWAKIKKEVLKAFTYIYAGEEERIALHALSLGKVLKGMSIADSISMGYTSIKSAVDDTMAKLTGPFWQNTVDFAQQHAGELIVDLTQSHFKKIHDTIQTSIINRASHDELKDKLFEKFGEMNRDWRRIAETEIGNAQNNGQLLTEIERAKPDETIFMKGVSSAEACPWCKGEVDQKIVVLLNEPPEEGGDQVEINGVVYTAIWPGKDNYGRARRDWWVAAGTQHPHCRCTWVKHIPGYEDIDEKYRQATTGCGYRRGW